MKTKTKPSRPSRKPTKNARVTAVAPLRISKYPLFAVVVIHADGSETVAVPCARPVAAAQYLSGYNSGHVACGEWAEAREIDLDSIRFTGRKLEHADVRGESKAYKMNRPRRREQAAAATPAEAAGGNAR